MPTHLEEYQVGLLTWIAVLLVYGAQGVLSVLVEGKEVHEREPDRNSQPPLGSVMVIGILFLILLLSAGVFVLQVVRPAGSILVLAVSGVGWMLALATMLLLYRRYYVPEELASEAREDEIPW